ncbi:hypothetical protein L596_029291 [Steinernema carpocapsae]|uniref:Uncharacterized protein n=1 Tax=Steinernema carpocapsae TaxID=34508 RepID=A0A4U5LU83_STECR|nr:hypothetical protein L596_029291 [Steinernema carpocapsae]
MPTGQLINIYSSSGATSIIGPSGKLLRLQEGGEWVARRWARRGGEEVMQPRNCALFSRDDSCTCCGFKLGYWVGRRRRSAGLSTKIVFLPLSLLEFFDHFSV